MSKHPRYLAVDEKRLEIIPIAFKKYSSDKFTLKKIEPESIEDSYQPWSHYVVYNKKGRIKKNSSCK